MVSRNPNHDQRAMEILFPPEPPKTFPHSAVNTATIEEAERFFLGLSRSKLIEECHMPVTHRFQPGVYLREILMPSGAFVIGKEHVGDHYNHVISGSAIVIMDGHWIEAEAGMVIKSCAGVRKVLFIKEAMRWLTIHANPDNFGPDEIAALEEKLFRVTQVFKDHLAEVERMKAQTMEILKK